MTRREACIRFLECFVGGGFFYVTWKYAGSSGASSIEVTFSEMPGKGKVIFSQGVYLVGLTKGIKAFSARCPHLGCQLTFDETEHRFQCPCHGSLFSIEGRWLEGPAKRDMTILDFHSDNRCGTYKVISPPS